MAKLIKCKTCSNQISSAAPVCPHCGEKKNAGGCLGLDGCGTVFLIFLVIIGFFIYSSSNNPSDNQSGSATNEPAKQAKKERKDLDLAKPLYTTDKAIVCPTKVILDPKTDHERIKGLWGNIISRSEKVKEAGCEEWRAGTKIISPDLQEKIVIFKSPYNYQEYMTQRFELTNSEKGEVEYKE
ncbi:hypothetical protein [Methylomonas fluvii]|uniref:Zinc ribbon domain-containing protein n=1 Tax=Methylomonas fluvii TaxID=1854564 RepID=A0ABR9DNE6_9GAMM|nr:hypothetical protein [Methylomonas fluvii]MBD9363789.1 hypothetical protein [Methylomonas fluvii]